MLDLSICRLFVLPFRSFLFFFNDTATTEIYTLSLHELFRSLRQACRDPATGSGGAAQVAAEGPSRAGDRKSTRLNSSHTVISYAVFCLKKKKKNKNKHEIKTKSIR